MLGAATKKRTSIADGIATVGIDVGGERKAAFRRFGSSGAPQPAVHAVFNVGPALVAAPRTSDGGAPTSAGPTAPYFPACSRSFARSSFHRASRSAIFASQPAVFGV